MKKYHFLLLLVLIAVSCTEDIRFNNPAFQTLKDNVFWRAVAYKAYVGANGHMIIEGTLGYENVVLETSSSAQKTYILGTDNTSKASYSNTYPGQTEKFSTGENAGNGQIIITEYNIEAKTISGTFKFTVINEDAANTEKPKITFTEGVFYKVPVNTPVTVEY